MERFKEAIIFAQSHEIPWPRDPTADRAHWGVHHDDPPPFNRLRGRCEIDGQRVQSVPGGTHWGGGVKISARDQARIGQLLLNGGVHHGQQIVPREWVQRMQEPCAVAPFYGWLAWLNRDGRLFADASRSSRCANRNGARALG